MVNPHHQNNNRYNLYNEENIIYDKVRAVSIRFYKMFAFHVYVPLHLPITMDMILGHDT